MLKALELFGFKSFADRTRFDFPPGITVVVGPNGSGKSNIVDGLKWVLGEQSAKSLRGKDMADVIFKGSGGSNGRKAANSAEATIILENVDRRFPYDNDEIHVTRRVYRSGESEYLINNDPVRLKDIRDLFRGTGVGTDAYSLIEQGKVDRMLQSTSKDRRAIFEEAAGISRFKAKKVETQRRLARVEQNLIRLADIVEEVGNRYRSVKAQASKAARYRQYTNRLKLLRTHAAKIDYTFFHSRLDKLENESQVVAQALEELVGGSDQSQQALQQLSEQTDQSQHEYQAIQKRVADLREQIAGIHSEAEAKQHRTTELQQRQKRLAGQIEGGKQRYQQLRNEQTLLLAEVEKVEAQHFDLRKQLETQQPELDHLLQQRTALEGQYQTNRDNHTNLLSLVTQLASKLSATVTEITSLDESLEKKSATLDGYVTQIADLQTQNQSLAKQAADLKGQAEQKDSALAGLSQQIVQLEAELESLRSEEAELKSQQNGDDQRSSVIREMESRLEGVNSGVKQVLESARQASSDDFSEVIGLVADLVQVDMQHAMLIDVALGEVAQHIVIDGNRLIHAVASDRVKLAGRVGLLQLSQPTTLGGRTDGQFDGGADVIGRADQMVQAKSGYEAFVGTLLGGTWIVKTLNAAIRFRKEGFDSLRFVTMSGEIIEADGRVIVGAKSPANNLVSRRSELRLLQTQMLQRRSQIEQLSHTIQQRREQLEADRGQHKRLLDEQKELSADLQKVQRSLDASGNQLQQIQSLQQQVQQECDQQKQRWEQLQTQRIDQQGEHDQHQQTITTLAASFSRNEQQLQELALQHSETEKTITTAKVKLAKVEQQLDQFVGQKEAIENAIQERDENLAELDTEYQAAFKEVQEIKVRLEEIQQLIDSNEYERTALAQQLEEASIRRDEVQQQRKALVELVESARASLKKQEKRKYEIEGETNQLVMQRNQLIERLRDDYGLEIEEVLQYQAQYTANAKEVEPSEDDQSDHESAPTENAVDEEAEGESSLPASDLQVDGQTNQLTVSNDVDPELAVSVDREEVDKEIQQLRRKINSIGAVNLDALAELEDLENRYNHLESHYQDLVSAKDGLERIIVRINADSRRIFAETLEIIRVNFQQLYRKTFGGGHADIVLEENEDILECGVEIVATPPGKSEFNNSLLSGGEKALTAVSLLMAIFKYRPSPFCVLDEVDAPFDEANIGRFIDVLKDFLGWTRFVIVTHSKKTMTAATTLYGVTMQDSGVSKRVSIKFEEVSEDGEILTQGDPASQAVQ